MKRVLATSAATVLLLAGVAFHFYAKRTASLAGYWLNEKGGSETLYLDNSGGVALMNGKDGTYSAGAYTLRSKDWVDLRFHDQIPWRTSWRQVSLSLKATADSLETTDSSGHVDTWRRIPKEQVPRPPAKR